MTREIIGCESFFGSSQSIVVAGVSTMVAPAFTNVNADAGRCLALPARGERGATQDVD